MMLKKCFLRLVALSLVLLHLHNAHALIATFEVHLGNLLHMQQGIGWPLHLNVAEGHEALIRLSENLENQESCVVTTPTGVIINVDSPPNNRFEKWSDGCGIRIRNVIPADTGRWRLTASKGNHSITGWSELDVGEKISSYSLSKISLTDGQINTEVSLTSLNNSYCLVAQPFSESSLVPGQCSVTLDRTTRAVQGKWSVLLGLAGQVVELHIDRTVTVEGERLDVGYIRDADNHKLHLYCNILHTAKNITFCRFQKNTETSGFNIVDGLSDGRYSYYGDGFFNRQCGMTIESATSEDYGTWRCTVGVQERVGTTIHQVTPMQALISVSADAVTRTRRDVVRSENEEIRSLFVQKDSSMTITCRADASLSYCWFQHPNGSQFTPVPRQSGLEQDFWYAGENLLLGDCGITFNHASEEDAGIWTCHMGYKYQLGIESTNRVDVRVTGPLAANIRKVHAGVGDIATLYCHTSNGPRPLDYCRFLSPHYIGFRLDSSVNEENKILGRYYFTPKRDLDHGDCSLTINPVLEEDFGEWTCAGLLHDHDLESSDTIHLHYDASTTWLIGMYVQKGNTILVSINESWSTILTLERLPRLQAGLIGASAGIVFLALVLAGTIWYKKGRPLPRVPTLFRRNQRLNNETDISLNRAVEVNMERRNTNSTVSSNEF